VLARVLAAIGRTMITAGVLVLLFVAYQLWGTGIRTAQAQNGLEDDFAAELQAAAAAVVSTTTSTTTSTTVDPAVTTTSRLPVTTAPALPPELLPLPGEAAGQIVIDSIGVDFVFVEGVTVDDLKRGPGHYPHSPLPGQSGNSALAGHRTTYGAPFANVDQLQRDDEIHITTVQGEFIYAVREIEIVEPSQVEVLDTDHWDFDDDGTPEANVLTLTACHPKYSARQRIIVGAELIGEPAPATPRPEPAAPSGDPEEPVTLEANLSGTRASAGPAVRWGIACAALWLVAWTVGRRWRRLRWPAYAVGIVPFGVALFFFFEEFSRLLPANY
jgi:sortase A